jgi:hypothetical protein
MTTSLSLSDIAPELRAGPRQFERWRRVRQPGDRIPDRLWKTAVAEARRHGVSRTANLLHLEDGKLEQLMTGRARARSHRHRRRLWSCLRCPPQGSASVRSRSRGPAVGGCGFGSAARRCRIWWRWRGWYGGAGM